MKYIKILSLSILSLILFNCDNNDDDMMTPLADFQFLVEGTQVTFNGTVENTDSILWDFGDGSTSSEENPVYAYAKAGEFTVTMTASGNGPAFTEVKQVTILPSLEILLTGGQARPEGKSWKLKKAYTTGLEGAGLVENDLGIFLPSQDNLLDLVGLGASYEDSFTFVHDGSYRVDNVDGNSLMGLVYALIERPGDIREVSADTQNVPLANVAYMPASGATWEVSEEDFTVLSINPNTGQPAQITFTDKMQLITGEYFGFKEAAGFVIIKDITETTMNVAISIGVVQDPNYYTIPTLMFHLSFEAN